jgi:hypothetical protein
MFQNKIREKFSFPLFLWGTFLRTIDLLQGSRLDEYVKSNPKFGGKVKVLRQEKRQGLMRSRSQF